MYTFLRYPIRAEVIQGFLWCNGEYKRGKAKVAWEDICLPKYGGLGICSLDVYKLKGRSFWEVPLKADIIWGWRKLLQLRDLVRHFFWVQLGNGNNTSVWFDMWWTYCPLVRLLSPRDITNEGFNLQNTVADMESNGGWIWPQSWLLKSSDLGLIPAPNLDTARHDSIR
ncbi:hypothetical protein Tco_1434501 [Tanacetum coccineum]